MTDDTEARLARLSANDRERLAAMLAERRGAALGSHAPRPHAGNPDRAPLSRQQERIWYLEQLGFATTFALVHVIRLNGVLDLSALDRAVALLVSRHDPLHTVVRVTDGVPHQVVLPLPTEPIRLVTACETPADGDRMVRETVDAMTGGALGADSSTFQCVLVQRADDEHTLVIGVHHIAFDGWSAGLLLDELSAAYTAFAAHTEPALPRLDYTYTDFATWQRAQPIDAAGAERWRRALSSLDAPA